MEKICLVAHLNDLSGANKSLVDLAVFLKTSFEVIVVVPRDGLLNEELKSLGIKTKIIYSGTWVSRKQESSIKAFTKKMLLKISERRFYQFFKKEKFSLIHFNSSTYGSGAVSAGKLDIPYTWHIRELAEENFSLTFFNRKKTFRLINSASKVITISNFMKNKISEDIKSDLIEVIHNGIVPYKSGFKLSKEKMKLVMIGAIAPDKGQLDAIRAVKYLKYNKKLEIELTIVGPITDKNYYNNLVFEIADDIKHLITFAGYQKDVSEYRKSNYIALVCSKAEAFGRVTIEAMNFHQIVIAANSGATPEIIDNNVNGFLYQTGDFVNLANTIHKVINLTMDQKSKIINNASIKVKSEFDIRLTAKRVKSIMTEIIHNN
ncbi:glycosyltransferase family 4 protein [Streptococcus hyovaginalis]